MKEKMHKKLQGLKFKLTGLNFERIILAFVSLLVLVLISATFISLYNTWSHKNNQDKISGNVINLELAPTIKVEPGTRNLGTISQKDGTVSTFFDIANTGKGDLIIEYLDTSCMCTSARIIYQNNKGPNFGMSMHGKNPDDYEVIIPPGESAQLEVTYDSLAHGIQKQLKQRIVREVTIGSNDPYNPQKKVKIELTQVP